MKINLFAKALIANSLLLFGMNVFAWSIESPIESAIEVPIIEEQTKLKEETSHRFQKKNSHLSKKETIEVNFWRAMGYLKQKDSVSAEDLFITNLNQFSKHHPSRIELVSIYLKSEDFEKAEIYLSEGLRGDSQNPDFLRLMATLHNVKGEPEKALPLLLKIKEPHVHQKNYLVLLGHVYQQLGHSTLARKQYFRLLNAEPNNPLWLLGITMSLDSEGQKEPALEGYRRLVKEGSIDPQILQYVRERINALKG